MRSVLTALLIGFVLIMPAAAQNESVTVTGKATDASRETIIRGFVKSYAAEGKVPGMAGKITTWQDPICPTTLGLKPEENEAVTERVRSVAANVDAPTGAKGACRVNIVIIFAPDPQELMDEIRLHNRKYHYLLGNNDGPMHAKIMAQVKFPVQAWYLTAFRDINGNRMLVDECNMCAIYSNGSRLNNGISSLFARVLVVVDINKAAGYEVGAMADYVAMLALTQTKDFGTCRELPSITNLLAPGCTVERQASRMTEVDLAYLRGVYNIDPAQGMNLSRADIYEEINKSADVKIPTP